MQQDTKKAKEWTTKMMTMKITTPTLMTMLIPLTKAKRKDRIARDSTKIHARRYLLISELISKN